jgi:hypothetical protein
MHELKPQTPVLRSLDLDLVLDVSRVPEADETLASAGSATF